MSKDKFEVWSANDEEFSYYSVEEVLGDYPELKVGDVCYKGVATRPTIQDLISANDVLETICCRAYDIGGEFGEDWLYVTKEAKEALGVALKKWANAHLPKISFYSVSNSAEYVITEEDIKEVGCE